MADRQRNPIIFSFAASGLLLQRTQRCDLRTRSPRWIACGQSSHPVSEPKDRMSMQIASLMLLVPEVSLSFVDGDFFDRHGRTVVERSRRECFSMRAQPRWISALRTDFSTTPRVGPHPFGWKIVDSRQSRPPFKRYGPRGTIRVRGFAHGSRDTRLQYGARCLRAALKWDYLVAGIDSPVDRRTHYVARDALDARPPLDHDAHGLALCLRFDESPQVDDAIDDNDVLLR